jgi:sigma-B regulation protein RsbU (phosphoserine phosphatase)
VRMVQAGHPHPVILRADGQRESLGEGGLPIGLIEGATYDRCTAQLRPGDRLVLVSDGITECPDAQGVELGQGGLLAILDRSRALPSPALLEALVWDLSAYAGTTLFPDDVSALLFDYLGR